MIDENLEKKKKVKLADKKPSFSNSETNIIYLF